MKPLIWKNVLFHPLHKRRTKNFCIHLEVTIIYIVILPRGYVNAFSFCQRNLDWLHIWKNNLLAHYVDGIMLTEPNKQEMASVLEVLVRQMCP